MPNAGSGISVEKHLDIVRRVVDREIWRGVSPWVDRSDLEDVAQLALVEAGAKYDGSYPFEAFAYRRVRSAVLDELRKSRVRTRGRSEMPEDVDRQPIPGPGLELYAALAALPPRQYRAVMLHFWGELTQAQVADELGMSQRGAGKLLEAAKKSLREVLNGKTQARI